MKRERIPELIAELQDELGSLGRVCQAVAETMQILPDDPLQKSIFTESLALKLHNPQ